MAVARNTVLLVGEPVTVFLNWSMSPATKLTVLLVSLPVVEPALIVTTIEVATPFFITVTVRAVPAPVGLPISMYKFLSVPVIGITDCLLAAATLQV